MARNYRGEFARVCINNAAKSQQLRESAQNNGVREAMHGHVLYWVGQARKAIAEYEYENCEIAILIDNAVHEFKKRWQRHLMGHVYRIDTQEEMQADFNRIMNQVSDTYNVSSTAIYYELALVGARAEQ